MGMKKIEEETKGFVKNRVRRKWWELDKLDDPRRVCFGKNSTIRICVFIVSIINMHIEMWVWIFHVNEEVYILLFFFCPWSCWEFVVLNDENFVSVLSSFCFYDLSNHLEIRFYAFPSNDKKVSSGKNNWHNFALCQNYCLERP